MMASPDLSAGVRQMVLASPRLTGMAGGATEVRRMLAAIEDAWVGARGLRIHLDIHPCPQPKASVVFQPGSGAHARAYFLLGGLLARHGYTFVGVDRPGHGLSDGERGDCTVAEAIAAAGAAIDHARSRASVPVVLMGSSMGGLLTIFGVLAGLTPDLAIAHNFVYPGKLFSFRLRARWIARRRTRPYPLTTLVHGYEDLSPDPAMARYMRERTDPFMAWELSPRSVASLFEFSAPRLGHAPPILVLTGDRDKAIPAWATRLFMRFSGIPSYEVRTVREAGHLLFHDHVDRSVPLIVDWLNAKLPEARH
jgi:alpha-beta hydrolase superfamily lysophospholipase